MTASDVVAALEAVLFKPIAELVGVVQIKRLICSEIVLMWIPSR